MEIVENDPGGGPSHSRPCRQAGVIADRVIEKAFRLGAVGPGTSERDQVEQQIAKPLMETG